MSKDIDPTECGEFLVKATTDLALLLVDADDNEHWIPKSQIDPDGGIDAESEPGDEGELIIPEWLAVEKGLV
jgi:hypothetical protein